MVSDAAVTHVEATGHTIVPRECGSTWHTHESSEWCIECGDYITPEARTEGVWDDPDKACEWGVS